MKLSRSAAAERLHLGVDAVLLVDQRQLGENAAKELVIATRERLDRVHIPAVRHELHLVNSSRHHSCCRGTRSGAQ